MLNLPNRSDIELTHRHLSTRHNCRHGMSMQTTFFLEQSRDLTVIFKLQVIADTGLGKQVEWFCYNMLEL